MKTASVHRMPDTKGLFIYCLPVQSLLWHGLLKENWNPGWKLAPFCNEDCKGIERLLKTRKRKDWCFIRFIFQTRPFESGLPGYGIGCLPPVLFTEHHASLSWEDVRLLSMHRCISTASSRWARPIAKEHCTLGTRGISGSPLITRDQK